MLSEKRLGSGLTCVADCVRVARVSDMVENFVVRRTARPFLMCERVRWEMETWRQRSYQFEMLYAIYKPVRIVFVKVVWLASWRLSKEREISSALNLSPCDG